jgi:nitrogen fixation protein FixH
MTRGFELKGIHVGVIIVLFFASVMAVNFYFVSKALATFPGEDEAKSFAQGLHFNDTLRDRAQQAALGWRAEADMAPGGVNGGAKVEVRVYDRSGSALTGLTLSGVLRDPVSAKFDAPLNFHAIGNVYVAETPVIRDGHWILRARASDGDRHLDLGRTFVWRRSHI